MTSRASQQHRRDAPTRPARTMTCQTAFSTIAHGCLHDLAANQGAACDGDREAVHRMRIALTRLRTARSFFLPFTATTRWAYLRAELKWLNRHLSKVRDLDVAAERLPPLDRQALEAQSLRETWQRACNASHRQLKRALRSNRYRTLIHETSNWIKRADSSNSPEQSRQGKPRSLMTYSTRQLGRWHRKLFKQGRSVENMSVRRRHQLRKKSKRLRYAVEFFEPLVPKSESKALLRSLRKIQKCLGQLNDAEQGRTIALALEKKARDDTTRWHLLFRTDQKTERRMLKTAFRTFRQMEELKPF